MTVHQDGERAGRTCMQRQACVAADQQRLCRQAVSPSGHTSRVKPWTALRTSLYAAAYHGGPVKPMHCRHGAAQNKLERQAIRAPIREDSPRLVPRSRSVSYKAVHWRGEQSMFGSLRVAEVQERKRTCSSVCACVCAIVQRLGETYVHPYCVYKVLEYSTQYVLVVCLLPGYDGSWIPMTNAHLSLINLLCTVSHSRWTFTCVHHLNLLTLSLGAQPHSRRDRAHTFALDRARHQGTFQWKRIKLSNRLVHLPYSCISLATRSTDVSSPLPCLDLSFQAFPRSFHLFHQLGFTALGPVDPRP